MPERHDGGDAARVLERRLGGGPTRPEVPSAKADSTCRVHPRPCRQYGVCVRVTLRDNAGQTQPRQIIILGGPKGASKSSARAESDGPGMDTRIMHDGRLNPPAKDRT